MSAEHPDPLTEIEFQGRLAPTLLDQLLDHYDREWWTQHRDRADVERMLAGSDMVIAAVTDGGERRELAGFVRAITDGVYRATIFDLIVAPAWRSRGLGAALLKRAHSHPALERCRRIELICLEEMVPWYRRFGYEVSSPEHLRMVWRRPG